MRITTLLAAILLAATACGGPNDAPDSDAPDGAASAPQAFETLQAGDPLPAAELERLGAEGTVDTASWRGRPTVINFWAVWCAFCVEEMPDLEAAHQLLGDEVRFVGVDREDPNEEEALALARETGVTYELVRDPDASYFRAVKGRGMPLTVLVDADGVIRYRHNGPLTTEELLDLVDEHLDV